jgi:hypothetical protein
MIMKNKFWKIISLLALVFALNTMTVTTADAQCPMCKIAAESNLKSGGKAGKGLNQGILYMLAMPYLLVGTIAFVWWRNRRKEQDLQEEEVI